MTFGMCVRELCCLPAIFYCLHLNNFVRVFYLFMFSKWLSFETARCYLLGSKSILHPQITGVYNNISSPVTRKPFKFGKNVSQSILKID